jgi:hypothetical protein
MARQGNKTMHRYPFVRTEDARAAHQSKTARRAARSSRKPENPGAIRFRGKSCHLCDNGNNGPGYDLWHVLFECPATRDQPDIAAVCKSCADFLPLLCNKIHIAVDQNSISMSNTQNAGVSHEDIVAAVDRVRDATERYDWDCVPGRWLMYTLLLALPFSERVVRPDVRSPIWLCKPKRRVKGIQRERDLLDMPDAVPNLPDAEYALPELVGQMFDRTILAGDALRPIADAWCRFALDGLYRVGRVVRPLRDAAERSRAAARVTAALDGDSEDRLTTSFVSSTDSDAGSGSSDSDSEP